MSEMKRMIMYLSASALVFSDKISR